MIEVDLNTMFVILDVGKVDHSVIKTGETRIVVDLICGSNLLRPERKKSECSGRGGRNGISQNPGIAKIGAVFAFAYGEPEPNSITFPFQKWAHLENSFCHLLQLSPNSVA